MSKISEKIRTVIVYTGLSVLVHLLALYSLGRCGKYDFTAPISPLQTEMVDWKKTVDGPAPIAAPDNLKTGPADNVAEDVADDGDHAQAHGEETATPPAVPEKDPLEPKGPDPVVIGKEKVNLIARVTGPTTAPQPAASRHISAATEILPPLRTAGEFLTAKSEKLTYQISLLGMPVGSVELEAKNENNQVRITLRTRTNTALSNIYPVDDVMETRHLGGNFIITSFRQKEGTFRSDIGFTIFLRDKRVFWVDRIRNRYSNETIPNSEVLDTLSSFYYLRKRPLQPGNTELLHIYDGDTYALVPIEILRNEEVQLRNLKKVDSLVLRHAKQKEIFRRTGDMMIWLTNDENKVPVKVETASPVGTVIVELVSAETQTFDRPETGE